MFIYKITNIVNGKIYIGQTIHSVTDRFRRHCNGHSKNMLIGKSIKKYGKENFVCETIYECVDIKELNEKEEYYILHCGSMVPLGYNISKGGFNKLMSEETKTKISLSNKGIPKSKEHSNKVKNRMLEIDPDYYKKLGKQRNKEVYTGNERANLSKGRKKALSSNFVGVNKEGLSYRCEFYHMGKKECKSFITEESAAHHYDNLLIGIGQSPINLPDDIWTDPYLENFRCKPIKRKSKYFGVQKTENGKFKVQIWLNRKSNYCGIYETEEMAALKANEFLISNSSPPRNVIP